MEGKMNHLGGVSEVGVLDVCDSFLEEGFIGGVCVNINDRRTKTLEESHPSAYVRSRKP